MTHYVYEKDSKIHVYWCNECGLIDLENPRDSESDHRDVLRFDCLNCKNMPYVHHSSVWDVIEVTDENRDEIIARLLNQQEEKDRCKQNT